MLGRVVRPAEHARQGRGGNPAGRPAAHDDDFGKTNASHDANPQSVLIWSGREFALVLCGQTKFMIASQVSVASSLGVGEEIAGSVATDSFIKEQETAVKQRLVPHARRLTLLATGALLAACGGGGGEGATSGGRFQTIDFKYPGGGMLLDGPVTLSALATSGLPVGFQSSTPAICTVSGAQLTLVKAGECRVVASQAGGNSSDGLTWAAADDVSQLFNVLKKTQQVTFAPPDYVLSANTTTVPLSATSPSGLAVTFKSNTPATCAIEGSNLKLLGKGTCAVTATAPSNDNWAEQSVDRFIAVDPLLIADGFQPSGAGRGSSNSMSTKQGGNVSVNPWGSPLSAGWEWCDGNAGGDWCYRDIPADGSTLTSALRYPEKNWTPGGWQTGFNRIDIFTPGLTGFNGSGDTTGGLQVTTETALGFTLGINSGLYAANKPVVLHLNLGKRNNGCNVELSTLVWPLNGLTSYAIPLTNFAVTNACGLAGVTAASLGTDIRTLPNPVTADGLVRFQAALERISGARASAMTLMKSSNIVQVRFRLMDVNDTQKTNGVYASDLTLKGAITIQ
ncbi:MAG: hypothetical protein ACT6S0_24665 [Roseateles sp.]|uniref:hypothetical protein n=1 Tax=Roseateles sp. TaxID=1971397 RepID=UPI004034FC7D